MTMMYHHYYMIVNTLSYRRFPDTDTDEYTEPPGNLVSPLKPCCQVDIPRSKNLPKFGLEVEG